MMSCGCVFWAYAIGSICGILATLDPQQARRTQAPRQARHMQGLPHSTTCTCHACLQVRGLRAGDSSVCPPTGLRWVQCDVNGGRPADGTAFHHEARAEALAN